MKTADILEQIERIKAAALVDEEDAHDKEGALYHNFIMSVSKRADSLGEKARLVLTTTDISFTRWRT